MALAHLDAVTFQIVYQLKIVAALICHRFLLGKRVSAMRWLSVLLLTIGVVFVQLSTIEPDSAATSSSAAAAASCSTDPLPSSSANADSASTGASAAEPPLD